jgi:hypothetical protein
MVTPMLTTPGERRKSHRGSLERRSYEVTEAIDPGFTWTHLDYEIEGLGRLPFDVTWHVDVTKGDVDPYLMCHMSLGFMRFTNPMCPIKHDTCHPL